MPIGAFKLNSIAKYLAPTALRPKTITVNGNAQVSTAQSKFGGASALFDGSGDYLNTAVYSDLNSASSDVTWECWIYVNNVTGAKIVMGGRYDYEPLIYLSGSTLRLYLSSNGTSWNLVNGATFGTLAINTWYHIAFVRNGTTVKTYRDGVEQSSTAVSTTAIWWTSTPQLYIGCIDPTLSNAFWNGYIDEVRISSTARYTAAFTPLSIPFTNDSNTVFLMHADGSNGSTTFTDDTSSVSAVSTSLAVSYGSSPYVIIYNRSTDTYTKIADPSSLPTGQSNGLSWTADKNSFAVAHNNTPYVTIYNRSGDTFTKLSNPGTLPTGNAEECAWNSDGTSLVVGHATTPFITIYNREGDTFNKLSNPATLPTGTAIGVGWNHNGTSLAVAHQVSPFVTIYNRSGNTFTKLSNPGTLPTSQATSISWNNDGTLLAVSIDNTTQKFFVYQRSGDTFTKLSDPATMPTGVCNGVAFSPDGTILAVAHDTSPYITIYNIVGTTLTKVTNPATLPTGNGISVAWDDEGTRLAVSHAVSPYVTIYNRSGDTYTKVSNPANLPTGTAEDVAWN